MTAILHTPEMRKYNIIWARIKRDRVAVLTCHPLKLKNIKRMISKEKDMDTAFKMMNDFAFWKLKFMWDGKKQVLTVKLVSTNDFMEKELML